MKTLILIIILLLSLIFGNKRKDAIIEKRDKQIKLLKDSLNKFWQDTITMKVIYDMPYRTKVLMAAKKLK